MKCYDNKPGLSHCCMPTTMMHVMRRPLAVHCLQYVPYSYQSLLLCVQMKWNQPEETGGEDVVAYHLQMLPSPQGFEELPDAQVGPVSGMRNVGAFCAANNQDIVQSLRGTGECLLW